jgi:hypothetical protein
VRKILPSNGYNSAIGVLKLIMLTKYKIITHSSLYFWGALLSENKNDNDEENVFVPSYVYNKSDIPKFWYKI